MIFCVETVSEDFVSVLSFVPGPRVGVGSFVVLSVVERGPRSVSDKLGVLRWELLVLVLVVLFPEVVRLGVVVVLIRVVVVIPGKGIGGIVIGRLMVGTVNGRLNVGTEKVKTGVGIIIVGIGIFEAILENRL